MDAYIPNSYIANEFQKLDIYKRIAGIENQEEYEDMLEELLDRFGEPPKAVMNLLAIAVLKAMAHRAYLREVKQRGAQIRLTLYEKAKIDVAGIPVLLQEYGRRLQFKAEERPYFLFQLQGEGISEIQKLVERLDQLAQDYAETAKQV